MARNVTEPYEPRASAIAEIGRWGPFFALATHETGACLAVPWRPLRSLIDDPEALRGRAAEVRARLAAGNGREPGEVPMRAAASVAQLGLTARLVSPVLGYAVLTGDVLDLSGAWWRPEFGAFPLSLPGRPRAGGDDVAEAVLDGPVRGLVEAARGLSVSGRVLWGNVASAINGAAGMIVRTRPDLAAAATGLAARVLAHPRLRAAYDGSAGAFRRRSCCLIYQAGPPGAPRQLCGDCILASDGH